MPEQHGFDNLGGVQAIGEAELVEPYCDEFATAAAAKKIPLESLKRLSSPMHLIKVTLKHIDFLSSAFLLYIRQVRSADRT